MAPSAEFARIDDDVAAALMAVMTATVRRLVADIDMGGDGDPELLSHAIEVLRWTAGWQPGRFVVPADDEAV